jgi:hypothetical protein
MPETYLADPVGSFLRPSRVREARAAFREGRTGREELARAEDTDITTYPSIAQDCFPTHKIVSLHSGKYITLTLKTANSYTGLSRCSAGITRYHYCKGGGLRIDQHI